jgi:hypothetical protein
MGLDTYASRSPEDIYLTEEDQKAFAEANIELCGGIYSGGGNDGSFRGKVYATAILEITGQGLYQEWIPPGTVREMYAALQACDPQEDTWDRVTPQEILELRKFFKVCSERGLGLIDWS